MAAPTPAPPAQNRSAVRARLETALTGSDEVDAFMLTCYPQVHRLFSSSMTRTHKFNLLLEHIPAEEIEVQLGEFLTRSAPARKLGGSPRKTLPPRRFGAKLWRMLGLAMLYSWLQQLWLWLKQGLPHLLKLLFTGGSTLPAVATATAATALVVGAAVLVAPTTTRSRPIPTQQKVSGAPAPRTQAVAAEAVVPLGSLNPDLGMQNAEASSFGRSDLSAAEPIVMHALPQRTQTQTSKPGLSSGSAPPNRVFIEAPNKAAKEESKEDEHTPKFPD